MSLDTLDLRYSIGVANDSIHIVKDLQNLGMRDGKDDGVQENHLQLTKDPCHLISDDGARDGSARPLAVDLKHFSKSGTRPISGIADFVDALAALSIPGPMILTDPLTSRNFVGQGSQFLVWLNNSPDQRIKPARSRLLHITEVAVKRARFFFDASRRLDLSTKSASKRIHDMHLEILALRHPKLMNHRNIVKLLGWAVDESWHQVPLLVLEAAITDLEDFIQAYDESQDWNVTHHLCMDMGAGLDVLHQNGIIHGDFKPANVLIFLSPSQSTVVPYVAKLADFGFSVLEAQERSDDLIQILGYTPGWNAPEVTDERLKISSNDYCKADNYSFGLVIWSLSCLDGKIPLTADKHAANIAASCDIESLTDIPTSLQRTLSNAVQALLQFEVSERPAAVSNLLEEQSESAQSWLFDCAERDKALFTECRVKPVVHPWILPNVDHYLVEGFQKSFQNRSHTMSGGQLFAIFLESSLDRLTREGPSVETFWIQCLLEAAKKGFVPAQAVTQRVFSSYGLTWPVNIERDQVRQWLFNGACTGSRIAQSDLQILDPDLAKKAISVFHEQGGYHQHSLHPLPLSAEWKDVSLSTINLRFGKNADRDKSTLLHPLAVWNNHEAIQELLNCDIAALNTVNGNGETPLYLACMAGCVESVRVLCKHGADASIAENQMGISCLHWLFNFRPEDIDDVADLLRICGATTDAVCLSTSSVICHHLPFTLPPGTPLHWAAWTSNQRATTALLQLGANPSLRNRSDPYIDDLNVRYMDRVDTYPGQGTFSTPPAPVEGLNVLDMAVANHDWNILQAIHAKLNNTAHILDTDEEGYTPFHRLQYNWLGRTPAWTRYSHLAFAGAPLTRKGAIRNTVQALQAMGGQIDRLTGLDNKNERYWDHPGTLTPLMLAVTRCDLDAVEALLFCGADPNIINNLGLTSLAVLPEALDPLIESNNLLPVVRALLDHGAMPVYNHQHVLSPLQSAAVSGSLEIVDVLLSLGADPCEKSDGMDTLAMILEKEDIHHQFSNERTREEITDRQQQLCNLIQKYILSRFSPDHSEILEGVDKQNGTLLHYAVKSGLLPVVVALLKAGANPNIYRESIDEASCKDYNSSARTLIEGTPLDILLYGRMGLLKSQQRRDSYVSNTDYEYILGALDKVEDVLIHFDGQYMRPLAFSDGPY